jgi:hypothetical protein
MTITAPTPDPGNAPEGILEPPDPEPVVLDVPPDPEVAAFPDTLAPGIYTDGVLRATVVDGAIITELSPDAAIIPSAQPDSSAPVN